MSIKMDKHLDKISALKANTLTSHYRESVSSFLNELHNSSLLPDELFMDSIDCPRTHIEKFINGQKTLSYENLKLLAEYLGIEVDSVLNQDVNISQIKRKFKTPSALPSKYTKGAFSKKAMVANILDYVSKYRGKELTAKLILDFEIDKNIFQNTEEDKINYLFFEDVVSYLIDNNFSNSDIWFIGKNMIEFNSKSSFALKLSSFSTSKEMFEYYLNEGLPRVEQNNRYQLTYLDSKKCTLRSFERQVCQDIFKTKHIGSRYRCLYREGVLSATTKYLGLPSSLVSEQKCVHRGDDYCEFHIDYSFPEHFRIHNLTE